jgi:hypothetical protein
VLDEGKKELKNWASQTSEPSELRDEMFLKLRADAAIGPLGLEQEIARRMQLHQERLQTYKEIELRDFSKIKLSREAKIRHLILKAGISLEESRIAWSKDALATLK